jgi:hypothetical protein
MSAASAEGDQPKPPTTRKAVEKLHRGQWDDQRTLLATAIKDQNGEKVKFAKLVAETLKICQEGERRAWQLDQPAASKAPRKEGGAGHDAKPRQIGYLIVDPQAPPSP